MKIFNWEISSLLLILIAIVAVGFFYTNISLGQKIDAQSTSQAFSSNINNIGQSVVLIDSIYANPSNSATSCDFQGTGFFITTDGYILTTGHNVDNNDQEHSPCSGYPVQIQATLQNGTVLTAKLFNPSLNNLDLGVIKANGTFMKANLMSSNSVVKAGEQIGLIGYPLGFAKQAVSNGIVSFYGFENGVLTLRINSFTSAGDSGSPIFLSNTGEVIGVFEKSFIGNIPVINATGAPSTDAQYIVNTLGQYVLQVAQKTSQTGVGTAVPVDSSILSELK